MWYRFDPNSLDFKRVRLLTHFLKPIIILIVSLSIFFIVLLNYLLYKQNKEIRPEVIDIIFNNSFTLERFHLEVINSNFKYPDIVIAQAYIESSHFKSPVWLENNNMFGMKQATTRLTICKGTNLNHGVYDNWVDCVKDRLIYDAIYLYKLNREEYLEYLDKTYAEAGGTYYSDLIKQVIKKYNLDEYRIDL